MKIGSIQAQAGKRHKIIKMVFFLSTDLNWQVLVLSELSKTLTEHYSWT